MIIRARSTPNIAFIKYWGNRNEELRLPAADSLSMTLDQPTVEVSVEPSNEFIARSFDPHGDEKKLSDKETLRLQKHFTLALHYLESIGAENLPSSASIEIRSRVPRSIGLASSAAVFSALAQAYAGLCPTVSRQDISILARLGSGSASRSVFGGYSAMMRGTGDNSSSSYAEQIASPEHWKLWDIIIAPSVEEKKVGTTEGHAIAPTSPLFQKRLRDIPERQGRCIDALLKKDFHALQVVAEEDSLDMHAVMRSSTPPLEYLSTETYQIIEEIKTLRAQKDLAVLYTLDAGPTVHLVCNEDALPHTREYAQSKKNCFIFESSVGSGSMLI